ncbi:hypothetical protein FKM82_026897, partial [Ascaphus truei]
LPGTRVCSSPVPAYSGDVTDIARPLVRVVCFSESPGSTELRLLPVLLPAHVLTRGCVDSCGFRRCGASRAVLPSGVELPEVELCHLPPRLQSEK